MHLRRKFLRVFSALTAGLLFAHRSRAAAGEPHRADLHGVPIINVHTHPLYTLEENMPAETLGTEIKTRLAAMDSRGIRQAVLLCMGFETKTAPNRSFVGSRNQAFAFLRAAPDRFVVFTTVDFSTMDAPDFSARAVRDFTAAVHAGARGLKLELGKPSMHWMPMDDPRLDPIYAKAAELNVPIAYHTSDPEDFFLPANRFNFLLAKKGEEAKGYWENRDKLPSRERLYRERENMLRKHPATTFILVHMGWLSRQLPLLADILDRYPNVYTEVGAALEELGRTPAESAPFLVHYSERILFGTDGGIRPLTQGAWESFLDRHFEILETDRTGLKGGYPRSWPVSGLALPKEVLERIYYRNAEALFSRPVNAAAIGPNPP